MFSRVLALFILFSLGAVHPHERMVKSGSLDIWTQSFGEKRHESVLLISGLGTQGIYWPEEFCERLAGAGYFVVRFDNRDVGKSSIASEPYSLFDMAHDAVAVLDAYEIGKTHIIGASMGGSITQIIAATFPDRVLSAVMRGGTPDFNAAFKALDDKPVESPLSAPIKSYIEFYHRPHDPTKSVFEKHLDEWRAANGEKTPFDEVGMRAFIEKSLERGGHPAASSRHWEAISIAAERVRDLVSTIVAPTLIIHGREDPLFPEDHAIATVERIKGAKLVMYPEMGHAPNHIHWPLMTDAILSFLAERCF